MRYLNVILIVKIIKMIAELAHHILQLHHGEMSGKIQTGQKPLKGLKKRKGKVE